jgi:hypothetical protein
LTRFDSSSVKTLSRSTTNFSSGLIVRMRQCRLSRKCWRTWYVKKINDALKK